MDVASLRDSLGLRADNERLAGAARAHLEAWTGALGLGEMQVGWDVNGRAASGLAWDREGPPLIIPFKGI